MKSNKQKKTTQTPKNSDSLLSEKFTPGPWGCLIKRNVWGNLVKHVIYVGDNPIDEKKEICIVYACQSYCSDAIEINKKYEEQKANAHLIAAAPDLYLGLKTLVAELETLWDEGETDDLDLYEMEDLEQKQEAKLLANIETAKAALAKARGEKP